MEGDELEDLLEAVRALFDGRCELAEDRIEEGEWIVRVDGEWVHARCAADEGYAVTVPDD